MRTIIIALLIAFACSNELNTVEEEQLMWNPQGLVQCLKEAAPYSKVVIEIIKLVRAKDYVNAIAKAIELINTGSKLVKKCIEYIRGSEVQLTVDWNALGQCLLGVAELYKLEKKLADALAENNFAAILVICQALLKIANNKIPAECKQLLQN